ncbi:hypothetical protein PV05_07926 [Exophiala xenobiotica]|uniref:Survival Motor Neuron Gemin2-binding domain-containing protein n=1 Tax=Exophiala xenobiotica TaxID=348802 RepID=A0A0D2BIS3_9EURO|nr:uncharacterized protein PV05_07926 [Exophiala xenobiotica]KIW52276.1 hypothetical protein PV05_07926 [Exophiala xenobiotica]
MPKSKKAKTKHNSSKANGDSSQAEIWDDSALIRSWNDAVAEYEYYHSIHARGEDVEEVLRQAEEDEVRDAITTGLDEWLDVKADRELPATAGAGAGAEDVEDGEIEDGEVDEALAAAKAALSQQVQGNTPDQTVRRAKSATTAEASTQASAQQHHTSSQAPLPTIGPILPATSEQGPSSDQTLENIKMAYYWAGYYSGLYDGQRQAQQQAAGNGQTAKPGQDPEQTQTLGLKWG